MNPQQYPPQPGQGSGYPGQPGPYPPQGNYPPAQPGQWQQPGPQQGPYPPQPVGPAQGQPGMGYGQSQPGYPSQPPMPGQAPVPGYNPFAYPGEYDEKPKTKGPNKMIFVSIAVVVVLVAIIGGVIAMSGGGSSGNQNNGTQTPTGEQTTSTAGQDVVPRSDSTLDLSKKINNKDTLKAQTIKAKTKEQVNLSSGFSFMVSKVEDYTSPNPATKPATGKKFIVVTALVGNRNQSGNISVSYLDFRLRDESNQLIPGNPLTNELLNNPLSSPSEIKPGEQITGKVIFEVDADDTTWVFKHSETYQKTTDDTTFTVEGEIVVELATAASTTDTTTPTDTTPPAATPATN